MQLKRGDAICLRLLGINALHVQLFALERQLHVHHHKSNKGLSLLVGILLTEGFLKIGVGEKQWIGAGIISLLFD